MIIIGHHEKTSYCFRVFNPLHIGHLDYFTKAKKHGDFLLVIVNNDLQREIKGSKKFMNEKERAKIISHLSLVDYVYLSIDIDKTVSRTIRKFTKTMEVNIVYISLMVEIKVMNVQRKFVKN